MDPMQQLRSYRDAQPELAPEDFQVLRRQFERHLSAADLAREPRARVRRGFAFGAFGVAVAACATVAVVAAGPAPQASAAAVHLLAGAATTAAATSTEGVRTIVAHEEALGIDGDTEELGSAAYLARTVTTLQVPDGTGTWTRSTYSLPTETFFGGAVARAFEKRDNPNPATKQDPNVETSTNGTFTDGELGGNDNYFGADPQQFRTLPTDPTALLGALRDADLGAGVRTSEAEHVIAAASLVLDSGVADSKLQAAVFKALQQQPGLTVTDKSIDLDGRTGTAIGVPAEDEKTDTYQLILDPSSGAYLGHRQVSLVRMGAVPAGTVLDSTAITQQ